MVDFLLEHGSYLGIILVLVLTGCGLPLPEEIPIIFAGVASSVGKLNAWMALGSCLIGSLLGDAVLYAIGYHFGHNLMKAHPRLAWLLHADREAKMEALIRRYGLSVLLVARFLVFVRAPVYLSIGILRLSFRRFVLFDLFCAGAVVGLFFGLSYAFGDRVTQWIRNSELVLSGLVAVALLAVGIVVWFQRRRIGEFIASIANEGASDPPSDSAAGQPGPQKLSGESSPRRTEDRQAGETVNGQTGTANGHGAHGNNGQKPDEPTNFQSRSMV